MMDRKYFLGSTLALLTGKFIPLKNPRFNRYINDETGLYRQPPFLKQGDIIAITSPADAIALEELHPAIRQMESWGYKIKIGNTIGKKDFNSGGTDAERAKDFQDQLDNREVKAIMCARGGYGSVRIIDQINWDSYIKHPKWIMGFSDVTVFHSHIHNNYKIATIHSKMCNSFPDDLLKAEPLQIESINSINKALEGSKMKYSAERSVMNKEGRGIGILIGGNLKTIESLSGTSSDIKTDNKILFVEDTGEYLYSIDRMFWNLKRTGKLDHLKGLIIGGFSVKPDDPGEDFGKTVQQIVLEKVKQYDYPVCFNFPVGHQRSNFALKCGVKHTLTVKENEVSLIEL